MFQFSGNQSKVIHTSKGSSDEPLDDPYNCCTDLGANLVPVGNPCHLAHNKGAIPQAEFCCCGDFSVWETCPSPICEVQLEFHGDAITPCDCQIEPTGWELNTWPTGPWGGPVYTFKLNGKPCSDAIGSEPLHFLLCGLNSSSVTYTVRVFFCTEDPQTGTCSPDPNSICSKTVTSTVNCGTSDVGIGQWSKKLNVEDGYPNPATNSIRFKYSAPYDETMSVTLVNVLGTTVGTSSSAVARGDGNVSIDLSAVKTGNYYCIFDLAGNRVTKHLVIK